MTSLKTKAAIALLMVGVLLSMTACSGSTAVTDVTDTIGVIEGVLPIVLGLVPGGAVYVAPIESYLQTATTGLDQVSAILAAGGSTLSIAEKITAALAATIAAAPGIAALGPLPAEIATAISEIIADVQNILTEYGAPAVASSARQAREMYTAGTNDQKRLASAHRQCQLILHRLAR
jgi:hypothetical protein